MENKSVLLACYFLALQLTSCTRNSVAPLSEVVASYEQSFINTRYAHYSAGIWPKGNIRFVKSGQPECDLSFERFIGLPIFIKETHCSDSLWQFVNEMNKLHIVGIARHKRYSIYYSTLCDSTYDELSKRRASFFDIYATKIHQQHTCSSDNYRYAFIKSHSFFEIPLSLKRQHRIDRINENWFYFRTFAHSHHNYF